MFGFGFTVNSVGHFRALDCGLFCGLFICLGLRFDCLVCGYRLLWFCLFWCFDLLYCDWFMDIVGTGVCWWFVVGCGLIAFC